MDQKECKTCGEVKYLEMFPLNKSAPNGRGATCKCCVNTKRRQYRKDTNNLESKKYEKTVKGFLMRTYRNMQSRVTGVQKKKAHLYKGLDLLPREDFYTWALCSEDFKLLWEDWIVSQYDQKLTPSVDRVDSSKGYSLCNMRWITHSENSRLGTLSRYKNNQNTH